MIKEISGGVCAARGFQAAGVHCGVKADSSPEKNDLALTGNVPPPESTP